MEAINQKAAWYHKRIAEFQLQSVEFQRRSNRISVLRLVIFLSFIGLLVASIYFRSASASAAILLIFGVAFGKLIHIHNRIKADKRHYDLLVRINQDELDKLQLQLGKFYEGTEFIDPDHPYCLDLDLFGPHSLFQFLNRTVTSGGAELLARKMLQPDSWELLSDQQDAVRELSGSPDWCQNFLASGRAFQGQSGDIKALLNWVNSESASARWFKPALAIMPLLATITSVFYLTGFISGYPALIFLVANGILLYKVKPWADEVYNQTYRSIDTLRAYEAMIKQIERSNFKSKILTDLHSSFVDGSEKASRTIMELKNILSRIETRQNGLYWILNIYLLLDIIWLIQARNWTEKHRQYISVWFNSISNFEMLVSLGLSAHSQDQFAFPSFRQPGYTFSAHELGHPLIPIDERVSNNFDLRHQGTVVVLTGSNMSGKSTFLRTIGINIVLARLGSPVCASDMELGSFELFTSMRTTDSLEQHVSSFYAELERIRYLIQMLDKGVPTMYLLDELLKGTNSVDRNSGSTALIKQLRKGPSFGLISTHDLSLGKLSEQFDNVINHSFNSELEHGKLRFDYKLRAGLCQSFNASELMTQMGIEMENNHHTS